ncbi:hypothetical protein ZWY2020_024557 [Hordeum vulgare]|nr:hypothetical protein ZWY2020_024557 [Hordeum vulgare]
MVATAEGSDCAALDRVGVGAEEGVAPKKNGVLVKLPMCDKDQKVGEYEEFSISKHLYLRKKKAVHKTATTADKQLQSMLKRVGVNTIPAIEEVNIFKDDLVI